MVSSKLAQRRMRLASAGHAQRHPELILHLLVLTFVDSLRLDTGLKRETKEIAVTMADRDLWRALVHDSREYYPPLNNYYSNGK